MIKLAHEMVAASLKSDLLETILQVPRASLSRLLPWRPTTRRPRP
jgi:hypothetical protein